MYFLQRLHIREKLENQNLILNLVQGRDETLVLLALGDLPEAAWEDPRNARTLARARLCSSFWL